MVRGDNERGNRRALPIFAQTCFRIRGDYVMLTKEVSDGFAINLRCKCLISRVCHQLLVTNRYF